MIQNLENKMELQINSLETRIEKMQERFNKDLKSEVKSLSRVACIFLQLILCHLLRLVLFSPILKAVFSPCL